MTRQQKPIGKQQKSCTKTLPIIGFVTRWWRGWWNLIHLGLRFAIITWNNLYKMQKPGTSPGMITNLLGLIFSDFPGANSWDPETFRDEFQPLTGVVFCSQLGCSHGNNFHNFRNHCQSKFTISTRITLGTMIIPSWSWTLEDVFFWRIGSCRIL